MLYAPRAFRLWLSLILFDRRMQQLYAARVSGSEVLADRKLALLGALGRHALRARSRMTDLARSASLRGGAGDAGRGGSALGAV
jgi:hypothetical protein